MSEEWKEVKGFPKYEVSSLGRIRSIQGRVRIRNKILSPNLITSGYYSIMLCNDKGHFRKTIHRLVGLAFIENPENKEMIDHINHNKLDNNVSNLRWATRSENSKNLGTINPLRYIRKKNNRFAYRKNDKHVWFDSLDKAISYRDSICQD